MNRLIQTSFRGLAHAIIWGGLCLLPACIPYNRNPELDATQEKLYIVNEQLEQSTLAFRASSEKLLMEIAEAYDALQHPSVREALEKARRLRDATSELLVYLEEMEVRIVEASGGYNEQGRLVGGLDHVYQEHYTLEGNGAGYALEAQLVNYVALLYQLDPTLPHPAIIGVSTAHAAPNAMDFAHYYFKDTPTISCLMALKSIGWSLASSELEGMKILAKTAGHASSKESA